MPVNRGLDHLWYTKRDDNLVEDYSSCGIFSISSTSTEIHVWNINVDINLWRRWIFAMRDFAREQWNIIIILRMFLQRLLRLNWI